MSIKLSLQELKVQSFVTTVQNSENIVSGRVIPLSEPTYDCLSELVCAPHTCDPQECPTQEPPRQTEYCLTLAFGCNSMGSINPSNCI